MGVLLRRGRRFCFASRWRSGPLDHLQQQTKKAAHEATRAAAAWSVAIEQVLMHEAEAITTRIAAAESEALDLRRSLNALAKLWFFDGRTNRPMTLLGRAKRSTRSSRSLPGLETGRMIRLAKP